MDVVSKALEADQLVRGDLSSFAIDGIEPCVAVEPCTIAQLRTLLAEAQTRRLSIVPVGGAQHLSAGNAPAAYDVALSLRRLNRVVEHEAADMTVTVEAGLPLDALNARLAEHGQFLPLDPPCGHDATVGGMLAANAYGPLRHAFGTARDWLIGTRVVHADGTVSKSGGRVVKNVTGYDMHKLYVGSLGTLGVIAEATFKLAPLPHTRRTLAATFASAHDGTEFALAAVDAGLALHAAEVLSPVAAQAITGEPRWLVLARIAGGPAAVERSLRDMRLLADDSARVDISENAGVWQAWSREFRPTAVSLRASVLPSSVAETLDGLDRSFAGGQVRLSATAAAGVIRAQMEADDTTAAPLVERTREIISRCGGTLIVDAAPPRLKREIDVFGPARPDLAIMRRLKAQLDPRGTLAPGRFMGRL